MTQQALKPGFSESKWMHDAVDHVGSDDRVEGLLLFGSFAREEAASTSDLDLLVVHRGRTPDDLLDGVSSRVGLAFYGAERLEELSWRSPLFATHLAREGIILDDSTGALAAALRDVRGMTSVALDKLTARTARRCGVVLRDPSFRSADRLSAAEFFALSKQAAFLYGARLGKYEFNRHRAFADLEEADPRLRPDVENVVGLEPVWLASRRTSALPPEPVLLTTDVVESVARILRFVADR